MSIRAEEWAEFEDFGVSGGTPARCLERLGGFGTRSQLIDMAGRRALDAAVRAGTIVCIAQGRYSLPSADKARQIAHATRGLLCLTSAAIEHGWQVKAVPARPHIVLARGRRLASSLASDAVVHRFSIGPDDVSGMATSREATLRHCFRMLPEDEALAIGDSAARAGELEALRWVAATARGPSAPRIRDLAARSTAEAENPFESVLRCLCDRVIGLNATPQLLITSVDPWAKPDLVDRDLKIVIEADSFEWHGSRPALRRDARRYNRLVADGWLVLRFCWEDVMFDQGAVATVLERVVALRTREYTEVERR